MQNEFLNISHFLDALIIFSGLQKSPDLPAPDTVTDMVEPRERIGGCSFRPVSRKKWDVRLWVQSIAERGTSEIYHGRPKNANSFSQKPRFRISSHLWTPSTCSNRSGEKRRIWNFPKCSGKTNPRGFARSKGLCKKCGNVPIGYRTTRLS